MAPKAPIPTLVFLVRCPDRRGLVARVSTFFAERGFNVLDCRQHTDSRRETFFMRIQLDARDLGGSEPARAELEAAFGELAEPLEADWSMHPSEPPARMAILVTRTSHCLYDLLLRQREGELPCEIPLIVSNRKRLAPVAKQFGIPYHHLPVTPETKPEQEAALRRLLAEARVDLVVLARYMQVLSPPFVEAWAGRVINIHHGFLPAFQGASPYQRAHRHGVKMIGATAHYVTAELDEGPILEQDTVRVTHEDGPDDLVRRGRDVERQVLARAVKAHLEHRVILDGRRTVIFGGI